MTTQRIRLSKDVVEKAEIIAREFGLKNVKDAVEAVFRRHSDDYLYRRGLSMEHHSSILTTTSKKNDVEPPPISVQNDRQVECEALNELDDLLGA